jgi:Family of unknown function (DUF6580)
MNMNRSRLTVLAGMLLAAAVSRLLPHPPNFTPVAALALFGGASFSDKRTAFLVPLTALFLSDLWLGFYALTPLVYGCFAVSVCLGFWLRRGRGVARIAAAAVAGSVIFFIVTNLGVWAFDSLYPKTMAGITECYVAAIPFFRNTLAGDLVYSGLLFGGLALAEKRWPALAEAKPALA